MAFGMVGGNTFLSRCCGCPPVGAAVTASTRTRGYLDTERMCGPRGYLPLCACVQLGVYHPLVSLSVVHLHSSGNGSKPGQGSHR